MKVLVHAHDLLSLPISATYGDAPALITNPIANALVDSVQRQTFRNYRDCESYNFSIESASTAVYNLLLSVIKSVVCFFSG